jgi:Protein of unknown function (DUF3617)
MKMRTNVMMIGSALALAACSQGDVELKNASVEDVVKATANAQTLNPGQWATTTEVVSVDLPGMPGQSAAMKDQMTKALIGRQTVSENCVTPEQAKTPPAEMLAGGGSGDCRFDKYAMAGGKMDATLVCKPAAGGEMSMQMAGPFSGDSFALDATMQVAAPGMPGGKPMTIKTKMTGKRSGECKA